MRLSLLAAVLLSHIALVEGHLDHMVNVTISDEVVVVHCEVVVGDVDGLGNAGGISMVS